MTSASRLKIDALRKELEALIAEQLPLVALRRAALVHGGDLAQRGRGTTVGAREALDAACVALALLEAERKDAER